MNNTVSHLLAIMMLFCTALTAKADEKAGYTYTGEVAGVVCSACSSHVKKALSAIDGVTSVKVLKPEKEGEPARLEVVSNSPSLTRETAVKALGEHAKFYDIRSLALEQPK